jgi:hypothetical protein
VIEFAPKQPADMLEAHRRAERRTGRTGPKKPVASMRLNVEPILSIGEMTYFQFRGRAFGVPPLPWKAGERLMDARIRALEAAGILSTDPYNRTVRKDYYKALGQLAACLWRNCRPAGKLPRLFRRLGLLRNPFASATDEELLEHADFFFSRRMKSGVPSLATASPHPQMPSTS